MRQYQLRQVPGIGHGARIAEGQGHGDDAGPLYQFLHMTEEGHHFIVGPQYAFVHLVVLVWPVEQVQAQVEDQGAAGRDQRQRLRRFVELLEGGETSEQVVVDADVVMILLLSVVVHLINQAAHDRGRDERVVADPVCCFDQLE